MRGIVITLVAALAVFCVVQDTITAAGARRYVRMQRNTGAASAPLVKVDDVMTPAIREGVRTGLLSAGGVIVVGLALAGWHARRRR